MNFNSLISRRHSEKNDYLLNLGGNVEQDYLAIPQSEKTWLPNAIDDFEFGIDVTMPSSISTTEGLLGYSQFDASSNSRWYISIDSTGNILFRFYRFGQLSTSATPYLGQRITIKGVYVGGNGIELYINNVLVTNSASTARPTAPASNQQLFIGAFGNSSGDAPQTNTYFSGKIHSFFIDSEPWSLPEGSGFNTVSDLGTIAFGSTSNSGSLTYWDNNVWELE